MPPSRPIRICTSIPASDPMSLQAGVEKALGYGSDYVEVRFDYLDEANLEVLNPVLQRHADRCVYTCRRADEGGRFKGDEAARLRLLKALAELGPAFIDLELSTVREAPHLVEDLRSGGSSLIVSWHDFEETPSLETLKRVYSDAIRFGDVGKIVTVARDFTDNTAILSLYRSAERNRLIAFCMGEAGVLSRVFCTLLGSPFTYASLEGEPTAPGQISIKELKTFYDAL